MLYWIVRRLGQPIIYLLSLLQHYLYVRVRVRQGSRESNIALHTVSQSHNKDACGELIYAFTQALETPSDDMNNSIMLERDSME